MSKNSSCRAKSAKYIPGELTAPRHIHPSHYDLKMGVFEEHVHENPPRGYPRYRDDFLAPADAGCVCEETKKSSEPRGRTFVEDCDKIKIPDKTEKSAPYLAAFKNFVFAKKLHKENLEHEPLPDTIADQMYRKAQMLGIEPGTLLKEGNFASGVGWKGYPGHGATRCTKLKVYRPKTCAHGEIVQKSDRPKSVCHFDRKWRFIRRQKVTPIELAICWDMTPANPHDEPRPPTHIDGSNGSQAPAVFTLVHTPKENVKTFNECDCDENGPVEETKRERLKSAVEKEHPLCFEEEYRMRRVQSAYNLNKTDHKSSCGSKSSSGKSKAAAYKSTPNLTTSNSSSSASKLCGKCKKWYDTLPNARLCVACELKDTKPRQRPKSEFKSAFKAGVPNNTKTVSDNNNNRVYLNIPRQRDPFPRKLYSITSLAPPFSLQNGKRNDYPDNWRLASVYQHSYKPMHLRKRSLLASIFN